MSCGFMKTKIVGTKITGRMSGHFLVIFSLYGLDSNDLDLAQGHSYHFGLCGLAGSSLIPNLKLKYFQNYKHKGIYFGIVHVFSDLDL